MTGRFSGKAVAIAGGASGIGLAVASRFADEGARIALLDIDQSAIDKAIDSLRAGSGDAIGIATDVTDEQAVSGAFGQMRDKFGRLDVLINSAGIISRHPIERTTANEWRRVLDVDLSAIFLATKAAIPYFGNQGGAVVNIASVAGLVAVVNVAYVAAKGGVIALTKQLASELAKNRIRVNAVSPGYVTTPMNEDVRARKGDRFWIGRIPMRRYARPEEIASVCAFLASEEASYVTGANVVVDGGMSAVLLPDPVPVE